MSNTLDAIRQRILDHLATCRREASEPRMGCREVEIFSWVRTPRHRNIVLRTMRDLCAGGLITRSGGWCWLTEEAFEQYERDRVQP